MGTVASCSPVARRNLSQGHYAGKLSHSNQDAHDESGEDEEGCGYGECADGEIATLDFQQYRCFYAAVFGGFVVALDAEATALLPPRNRCKNPYTLGCLKIRYIHILIFPLQNDSKEVSSPTPKVPAQKDTSTKYQDHPPFPPPPPPVSSYQTQPTNQDQHSFQQYSSAPANSDEPPLQLKGIGVNFEDFKFTKEKLQFDRLFMGFGFVIPGSSASSGHDKSNPQPTYVVPLGTPVRSIVDGIVAAIPTLWSGDVSIQVTADGKMQKWIYETEHLINPKVAVGDKVVAGQIIGEVGSFGNGDPPGYGAVEIGLLKGDQTPEHVCPFAYLDDSIREATFAKMRDLFQSWEEYVGDQSLYVETEIPGCLTLQPIGG